MDRNKFYIVETKDKKLFAGYNQREPNTIRNEKNTSPAKKFLL
jgi:hypothetical protein